MSTATWAALSDELVYGAIAVYVLAMLAYAAETAGRVSGAARADQRERALVMSGAPAEPAASSAAGQVATSTSHRVRRLGAIAVSLTVLAFLLNIGAVAARGFAAQRAPWGNMYEFALVAGVTAGAAFLVSAARQPVRELGVWIVAVIGLTLGLAVTVLYTPADSLTPVLNSYWLVIHVAAAIVSGGVFTVGVVAAVLLLLRSRADRRAVAGRPRRGYAATLPSAETLNRVSHTAHMFAFPIWTFAVIAGAIWAENAWGRYWGWDPKETWAFITWVLYAAYLHAQATPAWRGSKASWFAIAGYTAFVFNFFGVNMWIPGLHSYAGV
jgi:cytochrome c-type biogenesis protein CcsB